MVSETQENKPKNEGELLPIGTIIREFYSIGTRASRFSHEPNEVRQLKVTLEVVGHSIDQWGIRRTIVKEIKKEFVD